MTAPSVDPEAFRAFEATGWDELASTYPRFLGEVTRRVVDALLDAAGVRPGVRLLDVATGPGYAAARARERGASPIGIDLAPQVVRLAAGLHPGIDFRQADAEALPFEAGAFDALVSNFGIGHFPQPERAVAEFARVLTPGGGLALSWWEGPARSRLPSVFMEAIDEAEAPPPRELPVGPPMLQFASDEALQALLTGAGLSEVVVQTVTFTHDVKSIDELWHGMLQGGVRLRWHIQLQPPDTQQRIRAVVERRLLPYARGGALALPIAVKIAAGRKGRAARPSGERQ